MAKGKVLVTGAAGHLGNVLVRELLQNGYEVRAMVLPNEDVSALLGLDVELKLGDVLDKDSLEQALRGVEYVFHMAGIVSIIPGQEELVWHVNVDGTHNVLEAVKKAGIKRLVYTSSIHALSRKWQDTITEEVPFDPDNAAGIYDRTKATASLIVKQAVEDGLNAVIVCPTGVIGPYDFRGSSMGELIHDFSQSHVHMLVEGAYDFVDVRDVAKGHRLALEKGGCGEVYILSGYQVGLLELKEMVQHMLGFTSPAIKIPLKLANNVADMATIYYRYAKKQPKFTRYALETVQSNSAISNQKAKCELGYSTHALLTTIEDTVKWWQCEDKKRWIEMAKVWDIS